MPVLHMKKILINSDDLSVKMLLFSFLFLVLGNSAVRAEWDPTKAALTSATGKLQKIQNSAHLCVSAGPCSELQFLARLEAEDYSSKFFGLLQSRAPICQLAVDQVRNPQITNQFSSASDLQKQMAKMFPEIGSVNHQRIAQCAKANDVSSRYKVAKYYQYMKRLNDGATRAVEELSAINRLLGENDPLPCEGNGVINQAYNRCLDLQAHCQASNNSLPAIAAQSADDEKKYLAAKDQIKSIDNQCLERALDYERFAQDVSPKNPEKVQCHQGQGTQDFVKICTSYHWDEKNKISQCQQARQSLQMTMAALEDANPWFRSENYFDLRKTKNVEESIHAQMLTNRVQLKKKVREFRDAGLCVNGFREAQSCDANQVRSLLAATPEIPERLGADKKNNSAFMYLEAQSCIEEGVRDQTTTAKVLNGAARDATLTILSAGVSGIAMGAKTALAARGVSLEFAAISVGRSVDAYYASDSYKEAYKQCAGDLENIELAARSMNTQCPGPKSNLAQAERAHSGCMSAVGFAALNTLPTVPLLPLTRQLVRDSVVARRAVAATETFHEVKPAYEPLKISRCALCGDQININEASLKHASQHFLKSGEDIASRARKNSSTSVFSSEVSIDQVIEGLRKADSLEPDHRAAQILSELPPGPREAQLKALQDQGVDSLGFDAKIKIKDQDYEVRIVTCELPTCGDGGKTFSKGDLISVIPLCGPGVLQIPTMSHLSQPHPRKIKVKNCK